ncbi:MAG: ATP-binding protein [Deltaproteobacteria bacterium]|jgi:hypothetical protein|nr:ATP-binding protein [Deltaproteobacteria bacterium]
MAQTNKALPIGIKSFAKIIKNDYIYVDKTRIIAQMIDEGSAAYFFARPRRFGKSLVASTLEALFSGQKELFKGLAIENRLDEELFAPRPLIALDMSLTNTNLGVDEFRRSLASLTSSSTIWREDAPSRASSAFSPANDFYFKPDPTLSAPQILGDLIKTLFTRSGRRIAIIIDEYDYPYLGFVKDPEKAEEIGLTMRNYYTRLKALGQYISFVFITGVSKRTGMGLFSALNNLDDISIDHKYAGLCGFTHEELIGNFGDRARKTATTLGKTPDELLEEFKNYYYGFSFDGNTRVYNPFSALLFLDENAFYNYWFDIGSSQTIAEYINDNCLTVEEFRKIPISRNFIRDPDPIDSSGPESFLYQTGYLSVRAGEIAYSYTLDYPNREVYQSMSRLLINTFFPNSSKAENARAKLRKSLKNVDARALIEALNYLSRKIPHDAYAQARRKTIIIDGIEINFSEWLYYSSILSFFIGEGVDARAEKYTCQGQSDLVALHDGQTWVIELTVTHDDNDVTAAQCALKRIREKGYAEPYDNPILLGIAINGSKRAIGAWEVGYKTDSLK